MKDRILFLGDKALGKRVLDYLLTIEDIKVDSILLDSPFDNQDTLALKKYDLILSVNYNKIIREPLLSSARLGCFNLHHSWRLRIRGRHCSTHAILLARKTNEWSHGTSLHRVVPALDAGNLIATYPCIITEEDTAFTLFNRCDDLGFDLIRYNFDKILLEKPDEFKPEEEYYIFRAKDLPSKEIDLAMSPLDVYDHVRALTFPPYEGPWALIDGVRRNLSITPLPGTSCLMNAGQNRLVYG